MTHLSRSPALKPQSAARGGFSLIEMLVVIALIAIIASLAISNIGKIFGGQEQKVAQIFVTETIKLPLTEYRIDTGTFPTTEQGLEALMQKPASVSGWKGPYVEEIPEDPWKEPYQYKYPGEKNINGSSGYDVWSKGPDKKSGTADDIGNWNTE